MEKMIYNYITTNILDGKQYVGAHLTDDINDGYLGSGKVLTRAIERYGRENFIKRILCECKTAGEAYKNEEKFIKEYKTLILDGGYNISPTGGVGYGGFHSEETKKKIGEIGKGRPCSDETKEKMSKSRTGKGNSMYGKKGKDSPFYGRHHNLEAKEKMRDTHQGENNPMYGKKPWNTGLTKKTDEKLRKMGEARIGEKHHNYGKTGRNSPSSKPVLQYTKENVFIKEWESMMDAVRALKIKGSSHISQCVNSKQKTAYGFIWRFKLIN